MNHPTHNPPDIHAHITQLWVYPVKSCAGVQVKEAVLTDTGLQWDRAFMVVDAQGQFVTQREQPRMALIQPSIDVHRLTLQAPDMPALTLDPQSDGALQIVQVWKDQLQAVDMGDAAAQWLTAFLNEGAVAGGGGTTAHRYRLVRFNPACKRPSSLTWTGGRLAYNQFADGFALLLASQASLDELNQRLQAQGHGPVEMLRFRPNIVIDGVAAQDEDRLGTLTLQADGQEPVHLLPVKPCARCPIPNIDPATGLSSPEVGDTLQTFRQNECMGGAVTFGMNLIITQGVGSMLRVGQAWQADFDFG